MMKRYQKLIFILLTLLFVFYVLPELIFGGIDYSETFATKYESNGNTKTIITSHFEIETPKNWIHVFHGYGNEGDAGGCFFTGSGIINYEYGFFANPFEVDSISVFQQDSMTLSRFTVFIGKNEINESGIHIPKQHEMELPSSFYMSKSCTENFVELTNGIRNMEFKKFYNIEWIEE